MPARVLKCSTRVSIHAPGEGSDRGVRGFVQTHDAFQSTLPVRGATEWMDGAATGAAVSIHAPGEGSDLRQAR